MKHKTSRRKFLADSAGATLTGLAATSIVKAAPTTAASYRKISGANDRLRVGMIGCAGMGSKDLLNMLTVKGVECGGLCDVDDARLARQVKILEDNNRIAPQFRVRDYRRIVGLFRRADDRLGRTHG
jgi:hypothetical protein